MKNVIAILATVALFCGLAALIGEAQEPKKAPAEKKEAAKLDKKIVKELMEKKLKHAQQLLAALVHNDLKKAGKEAEELQRVRKQAGWFIYQTKDYEMWSDEFATSAEQIIKAAKDGNPDSAKLGYLQMTMTCFNCHTYVRDLGDTHFEIAPK
jgi:hypothetical protein